MAYEISEQEMLRRKLYRLFNIQKQEYLVTYKLFYIYKFVHEDGSDPLIILKEMRRTSRRESNLATIDALYSYIEHQRLLKSGLYAPQGAKTPLNYETHHYGWRLA
jgi:hypothetical protein